MGLIIYCVFWYVVGAVIAAYEILVSGKSAPLKDCLIILSLSPIIFPALGIYLIIQKLWPS